MSEQNKTALQMANAAVSAGDNEGFLSYCADDIVWSTVGAGTLYGKNAVREWMTKEYADPPKFTVHNLIGEDDFVAVLGDILSKDEQGHLVQHSYCDVWRFRNGKLAELKAYVIKTAK